MRGKWAWVHFTPSPWRMPANALWNAESYSWTAHGFRSTFRDWAAERTAYPNEVAEMALAHAVGNKVEAAYRRGDLRDKRRRMMADWATYLSQPGQTDRNVIPIRWDGK